MLALGGDLLVTACYSEGKATTWRIPGHVHRRAVDETVGNRQEGCGIGKPTALPYRRIYRSVIVELSMKKGSWPVESFCQPASQGLRSCRK